MYVCCQRDEHGHMIELHGTIHEYKKLSEQLTNMSQAFGMESDRLVDTSYPEVLRSMVYEINEEAVPDGALHLTVLENVFYFRGSRGKINLLAENFKGFYDDNCQSPFHWHIDHWDGTGTLAPTEFSLVFSVD